MQVVFELKNTGGKIAENGFDYSDGNALYINVDLRDVQTMIDGESEKSQQDSVEVTLFDVLNKWISGNFIYSYAFDNLRQDFEMVDTFNLIVGGFRYEIAGFTFEESKNIGRSKREYKVSILLTENINIGRNA